MGQNGERKVQDTLDGSIEKKETLQDTTEEEKLKMSQSNNKKIIECDKEVF